MTIQNIIDTAKAKGLIINQLVKCSICERPASRKLSRLRDEIQCAPCFTGDPDSFSFKDTIAID